MDALAPFEGPSWPPSARTPPPPLDATG